MSLIKTFLCFFLASTSTMAISMNGYGAEIRGHSDFGQGGLQIITIDDNFADVLPYPYLENIIEVKKTGAGSVTFYVPNPVNLPRGACLHVLYTNGNRELIFSNPPGATILSNINGDTIPVSYPASGGREFFIISCGDSGWTIHKGPDPPAPPTPVAHPITFIGTFPEVIVDVNTPYALDIPGNFIDLESSGEIIETRVHAVRTEGVDNLSVYWEQGASSGIIFGDGIAGPNNTIIMQLHTTIANLGGGSYQLRTYALSTTSDGTIKVQQTQANGVDATQPWKFSVRTTGITAYLLSSMNSRALKNGF